MNPGELATITKLVDDVFQSLHKEIDDVKAQVNMMLRLVNSSNTTASKLSRLDTALVTHPPEPNVSVKVVPIAEELFKMTSRPTIKTPPNSHVSGLELSTVPKSKKHVEEIETPPVIEEAVEEETAEEEAAEETAEEEVVEETAEEEAAEETAEEEVVEETAEEEAVEETAEEEVAEEAVEEEEVAEEVAEEAAEEEVAEEEAEEVVVEYEEDTINDRNYFRAKIDGEYKIFAMISEEEPGDEVGRYIKGKPVFDRVRELSIKLRKYYIGLDEPYTIYEYVAGKQQPGAILGIFKDNKAPVWTKI